MRRAIVSPGSLRSDRVALEREALHHLRDVLRLRDGELVELCDGDGAKVRGRLDGDGVQVLERDPVAAPPRPEVTVLQGWAKGEKMDRVVRQVAEIGARRFVPVRTERSVPKGGGKADRWRTIAEDALRVSGRAHRLLIDPPATLGDVLAGSGDGDADRLDLCFDGAAQHGVRDLPETPPARVRLLIGPEGGFEPDERDAIVAAGFRCVRLGDGTLRTETAGPAALAALLLGRWAG